MDSLSVLILIFCLAGLGLTLIFNKSGISSHPSVGWRLLGLLLMVPFAYWLVLQFGHAASPAFMPFGPAIDISSLPIIILVFVFILLGMAARYFFYLKTKFSWQNFLRPVFISPIVLLPLLGAIYGNSQATIQQIISLLALAFQNGFFWRVVFEGKQGGSPNGK